jgi:hypothetical protein
MRPIRLLQCQVRNIPSGGTNHASELQLHNDHVDQSCDRRAPGFNHKVGCLTVQRISDCIQIAQTGQRVRNLQQRPVDVVPQAPKKLLGG